MVEPEIWAARGCYSRFSQDHVHGLGLALARIRRLLHRTEWYILEVQDNYVDDPTDDETKVGMQSAILRKRKYLCGVVHMLWVIGCALCTGFNERPPEHADSIRESNGL